MYIPAIPTSSVGTLPAVLRRLEADVTKIQENPENATYKQTLVAGAVGSLAVLFFATVDEVIHATCLVAKAVPVGFKVTIGRLTGLDKYITSPGLTGEDYIGHARKIRDCVVLQLMSLAVLIGVNPEYMVHLSKKLSVLPVGSNGIAAVDKV